MTAPLRYTDAPLAQLALPLKSLTSPMLLTHGTHATEPLTGEELQELLSHRSTKSRFACLMDMHLQRTVLAKGHGGGGGGGGGGGAGASAAVRARAFVDGPGAVGAGDGSGGGAPSGGRPRPASAMSKVCVPS